MNIKFPEQIKKYDRFQIDCFDIKPQLAEFVSPSGKSFASEFFLYQPADFVYDHHGYEKTVKAGEPYFSARFTPDEEGIYKFSITYGDKTVFTGEFECIPSENRGFVGVSKKDCRYFAYSDGTTYCPVGINMCYPTEYAKSSGSEFGSTGKFDYLGLHQYKQWMDALADAGGNFARIWLGKEYFSPDCEDCRDLKYEQFTKLDKLVEMAREHGIKLKLTFEHFRKVLTPDQTGATGIAAIFDKTFCIDGEYCPDFETWITDEKWQTPWRNKIDEFLKRYGGDTTIFAFELWNEMNCVETSTEAMLAWTDKMCEYIRKKAPQNMAVNSVGSYDNAKWASFYKMFESDKLSFSQIHRYIDQGAKLEECYTDIPLMAKAGFDRMWKKKNPVILAETGAVNNSHVGPFRYYDSDYDGIIFADATYPAFFCESAGCGQIWHWDARYVSGRNLYKMYKPFADMVKGEQLDDEDFKFVNLSNKMAYILLLVGKTKIFGLVRNTSHNWETVLRDLSTPTTRLPIAIDSTDFYLDGFNLTTYPIWENDTTEIKINNRRIEINNLNYGTMFKLKKK